MLPGYDPERRIDCRKVGEETEDADATTHDPRARPLTRHQNPVRLAASVQYK